LSGSICQSFTGRLKALIFTGGSKPKYMPHASDTLSSQLKSPRRMLTLYYSADIKTPL